MYVCMYVCRLFGHHVPNKQSRFVGLLGIAITVIARLMKPGHVYWSKDT
jgi:hypothetical protein